MPPPQAPTSFIPKKPFETGATYNERGGAGFLFFISLFIFIASVVAAGGVFAYQGILNSSIAGKQGSLKKDEAAFDPQTISDLVRMDARINAAGTLLNKHVAPSAVFAFLSQQTLQRVQFTNFQYTLNSDGSAAVVLAGTADGFSTVALQSDQFGAASGVLKDVLFSDIKTGNGGSITFSVSATVSAAFINYAKNLGNAAAQPVIQTTAPAPQATSSSPSAGSGQTR